MLEVCVDSAESAVAACEGGADRIELCCALALGGLTPGIFLYRKIRELTNIRIHVMIRSREGDFCYSDLEFEMMEKEIRAFREEGADGFVFGVLRPDGRIDRERMEKLMDAAAGRHVTLHRAFDVCCDVEEALDAAWMLGIKSILSSGQAPSAAEGIPCLKEIAGKSRIPVMAGGGIHAGCIPLIIKETGISNFHMSGKKWTDGAMRYRRKISMGTASGDEYGFWRTDAGEIKAAKAVLEQATFKYGVRNENEK